MSPVKERAVRFGVTDGKGHRSATWKCWTYVGASKSDVYLACRELRGELKASFHESGSWHIAYSNNFFRNGFEESSKPESRFTQQWPRPPEIAKGITLAFRIVIPWSATKTPITSRDSGVKWIPTPEAGKAIETDIFITSKTVQCTDWPGKNSMRTELVGSFPLESGETMWLVYHVISCPQPRPLHGSPKYFKGKSKSDLGGSGLRMLAWGDEPDGSRTLYDLPVDIQHPEK
jgi:hypothetical protein